MTEEQSGQQHVIVVGPDGQPVAVPADAVSRPTEDEDSDDLRELTDLVEQPAKVMRIGSMIRQLLEEVKSAPLDDASRNRLKEIHRSSIKELESGPGARAGRGAGAAVAAVHRGRDALGRRAADRPGPAGRLARGPVPRHPDRDLRPAGLGARAVRADASRPAGRPGSRRSRAATRGARPAGRVDARAGPERDVSLGRLPAGSGRGVDEGLERRTIRHHVARHVGEPQPMLAGVAAKDPEGIVDADVECPGDCTLRLLDDDPAV